jgi:hypothetical protein
MTKSLKVLTMRQYKQVKQEVVPLSILMARLVTVALTKEDHKRKEEKRREEKRRMLFDSQVQGSAL